MRRILKRLTLTAAAVLAAAVVFVVLTLPPRTRSIAATVNDGRLVWGAYHVHSTASDGSGSVDDIAAAAARAGLHFVVFTDHGDATVLPAPEYRHGVLCIHSPEINSDSGHLVAIGLTSASAYPLAGEARDVIEDIRRLGGAAIAAHPDSPRQNLRWRGQPGAVDGFEWFNVDSEWRGRGTWEVAGAGLRSLLRGPESLAALFRAPRSFSRWDRGAGPSPLFSLAALDAHARVGADRDAAPPGASIRIPSYTTMFRTVSQAVPLEHALTGDPSSDARAVIAGIIQRRSYAIFRAMGDGLAPLRFENVTGQQVVAELAGIEGGQLRLWRNGELLASGPTRLDTGPYGAPGDYRVEAWLKDTRFPWMVSDVIRISPGTPAPVGQSTPAPAAPQPRVAVPVARWQIEKHKDSTATIATSGDGVVLTYALGSGTPAGQYVALSAPAGTEPVAAIRFLGSSRQPMRLSVQVRVAGGTDGRRWRRSVYLDGTPREVVVSLADMQPVDRPTSLRPVVARIQSLLLVVDTVNSRPGSSGEITIRGAQVVRGTSPEGPTSSR